MKIPSFEEYKAVVKKDFWRAWPQLTEKEVDEYLNSEEEDTYIRTRYESDIEEFKSGKITYDVLMVGGTSGVGMYLDYMY